MLYTIENDNLTVKVNDFGAELTSVVFKGKERLWQNENGGWVGHSPIMFPACGSCEVVVNGKVYTHFLHGFARKSTFSVTAQGKDFVTMTLSSSEKTKECYPYDFRLAFTYRLEGDTLRVTHEVYNPSDEDIYCAFGSHESYQLDGDVDGYVIEFEKEETFDSLLHTPDTGKLTGEIKNFGKGKILPLPTDFLQEGRTLIFKNVNSRKVTLKTTAGRGCAEVAFEGFPNLLLWRPHGAKMICIEPWQNLPDSVGKEFIEFSEKTAIDTVKPRQTKTAIRSIRYF
ncbi:MAG: hypothetical protein IJ506_00695 [Clostridia bacterium]|nr:hypothetical protein [Clostridia bacterium]